MIPWTYKNNVILEVESLPDNAIGFVYLLEFSNGMKYIGRKSLYHTRTLKPLKGKKRKRKKTVDSDWKTYCGSIKNEEFCEGFKSKKITVVKREIVHICYDQWDLTYYETKYQFDSDCLIKEDYYNQNILGKFYRKRVNVG